MDSPKPLIAVACFCENILTEKDGVLSAIRIVDTYTIPQIPEGAQMPDGLQGVIMLNGLITLKSGDFAGSGKVSLVMQRVTGDRVALSPPEGWPVTLNGGEHGSSIQLHMPLGIKNFGLVWFDVLWNDEVITRIPLKLQQGPPPNTTTPSSPA